MKEKVVIITGGSSGIGKALAECYLSHKWRVVISGRNQERLDAAAEELRANGGEVLAVRGDVAKKEDSDKLIEDTLTAFGRIDVLINNAGITMRALFKDADVEVLEKVMQINWAGMVYCTKAAIPHIIRSKGSIVGISSIAGHRGLPGRTGYSASKFAMNGFLEALRSEMIPEGVNVLIACPGYTASNIRNAALVGDGSQQGESPREEEKMMTSEEAAGRIFRAVEKRKRSLVMTSEGKLAVFLNKWMPGMMDKILYKRIAKEEGFNSGS